MSKTQFRVFDNQTKQYADATKFVIDNTGSIYEIEDHSIRMVMDRYTIELYSGKHDNKGNEIFEGDQLIDHDDDKFYSVYWGNDAAWHCGKEWLDWIYPNAEIIGTIHDM